jgi:hypothetical protein
VSCRIFCALQSWRRATCDLLDRGLLELAFESGKVSVVIDIVSVSFPSDVPDSELDFAIP